MSTWDGLNISVFTSSLELVVSAIESCDMRITISSAVSGTNKISTLPGSGDTLAVVTILLHLFAFLV